MRILPIGLLCLLLGCSSLNRNKVAEGSVNFRGGISHSREWSESLNFKRYSWFKGLTLVFDLLVAPLPPDSPFYHWASPGERGALQSCHKVLIVLNYNQGHPRATQGMFVQQMEKSGHTKVGLPNFGKHLKMHPGYNESGLQLYRSYALCAKSEPLPSSIHFPGFRAISLNI